MIIRKETIESIDFQNLKIYDYTDSHDFRSSLAMIEVPPGARHSESWSKRSEKIYFIISGILDFTLAGENHVLNTGDVCIVRQGQHFSYKNLSDTMTKIILVHTPSFNLDYEEFVSD